MSCFNSVCVKVERSALKAGAPPLRLFMQSIDVDVNLSLPYQQIIDTMRLLFGQDVIVTFSSNIITYKNK